MSSTEDNKEATAISHSTPPEEEEPIEEGGALDLGKKKKKKPKKETAETAETAEDGDGDGEAPAEEAAADGLDPTLKKKKKKKPKTENEFAAKLAALDLDKDGEEKLDEQAGDPEKGTGIWQHDTTTPITYNLLLGRFFDLLAEKNPDHASTGSRSYKIPPPQCLREGNKKTIFANIEEITKRSEYHTPSPSGRVISLTLSTPPHHLLTRYYSEAKLRTRNCLSGKHHPASLLGLHPNKCDWVTKFA